MRIEQILFMLFCIAVIFIARPIEKSMMSDKEKKNLEFRKKIKQQKKEERNERRLQGKALRAEQKRFESRSPEEIEKDNKEFKIKNKEQQLEQAERYRLEQIKELKNTKKEDVVSFYSAAINSCEKVIEILDFDRLQVAMYIYFYTPYIVRKGKIHKYEGLDIRHEAKLKEIVRTYLDVDSLVGNTKIYLYLVLIKSEINQESYLKVGTTSLSDSDKLFSDSLVISVKKLLLFVEIDKLVAHSMVYGLILRYAPSNNPDTHFDEYTKFDGYKEILNMNLASAIIDDINYIKDNESIGINYLKKAFDDKFLESCDIAKYTNKEILNIEGKAYIKVKNSKELSTCLRRVKGSGVKRIINHLSKVMGERQSQLLNVVCCKGPDSFEHMEFDLDTVKEFKEGYKKEVVLIKKDFSLWLNKREVVINKWIDYINSRNDADECLSKKVYQVFSDEYVFRPISDDVDVFWDRLDEKEDVSTPLCGFLEVNPYIYNIIIRKQGMNGIWFKLEREPTISEKIGMLDY